jgi:ABC-type transport system involved in multi-copper enzyme maturation permease subunit
MRQAALVAGSVFKESVRDRVPYSLVLFAILLMAASYLISQLTAGQDLKIIKDLGLASIGVIGLLIAIFIGIGLVSKEVERRSIYSLLAKPVSRTSFILGKFGGLVLTLVANVSAMTVAYFLVLAYMHWMADPGVRAAWPAPAMDPWLLVPIVLILGQLTIVTAIALLFSTFSSPLLAALMTLGVWAAGHFNADLRNLETVIDSPFAVYAARAMYYLLPNFAAFDVKAQVVHGEGISLLQASVTLLYAVVYVSALLAVAVVIFRRRDFR